MEKYLPAFEQKMQSFYNTLSEKDKRHCAAIKALKLGYGGIICISDALGCSRNTVARGIKELDNENADINCNQRIRKPGGGRKSYEHHIEDIDKKFLNVLKDYTAGDPMDDYVLWTNPVQQEISDLLFEEYGIRVSRTVISKLLKKHNCKRRKAQKRQTLKEAENRNEQFENILNIKSEYEKKNQPVISIDTKKKNIQEIFTVKDCYTPGMKSELRIMISVHFQTELQFRMEFTI